ncbi:hypothetical protein Aab01nite_52760 [Paractinoplanes abujensis]|uniref:Sugar/nucleoside kinase (Ribokinase family) n=1 Tax=Paractinoplanes abujensis TaxID=882441 RepID=A0A7W7G4B7_9ACTN|nr:PfkB family carbohydrate kinase [Actinoplanes abujensis]MBB4693656.1 sugar/nucleoside kinase (ribokinase family) [Actinoplanes abujensis]GID21686.1 hypothetical protein Aab01nite_52760 [Actinoplanes abujensis]
MRLHPGEIEATGRRATTLDEVVRRLFDASPGVSARPRIIAIDGRGGAGKTTLAERLRTAVPGSAIVHTDDVAWNLAYFDWGATLAEHVLAPLHRGRAVDFRPAAWAAHDRSGSIRVPAGAPVVWVEGTGVLRSELAPWLDASIYVQGDLDEQERLLAARDGDSPEQREHIAKWLAEELPFLLREQPWARATLIVAGPAPELLVAEPVPARAGVLVLGGAGVDHVVRVPQLPLPPADSTHSTVHTRAGQTGDFVALGLHALGLPTTHLDVLGDDPEGALVRDLHERQGVPFHTIGTPRGTKRSVNLVDPRGRRQSLYDSSRGAGGVTFPPDLLATLAGTARHAHVCVTEPCAEAIPALVAAGLTISTDLHDWDGADDHHRRFAEQADIVFLSTVNLPDHESAMRSIGGRAVVVATAGDRGGYVLDPADGQISPYGPATPPAEVRDTNGAGDAFVAGFLYGHLTGEPLARCLRLGAIAGAHACTVPATEVGPIDVETLTSRLR